MTFADHTPLRPSDGLHTRVLGADVIVLDEERMNAHVLRGASAELWLLISNAAWGGARAEVPSQLEPTVTELMELGLVTGYAPASLSRRDVLLRGGAVAALAAGGILSMQLPAAAAADSNFNTVTDLTSTPPSPEPSFPYILSARVTDIKNPSSVTPTGRAQLYTVPTIGSPVVDGAAINLSSGVATWPSRNRPTSTSPDERFKADYVPGSHNPSSSGNLTVPASRVPGAAGTPAVTVAFSPSTPMVGQTVTVTVTVTGGTNNGSPSGTVTLKRGGIDLQAAKSLAKAAGLTSTAEFSIVAGGNPCSLTADYSPATGSAYLTAATGGATVVPYTKVAGSCQLGATSATKGSTYQLTVRVKPATTAGPDAAGNVALSDTHSNTTITPASQPLINGTATFTVTNTSANNKLVALAASYTAAAGELNYNNGSGTAASYSTA